MHPMGNVESIRRSKCTVSCRVTAPTFRVVSNERSCARVIKEEQVQGWNERRQDVALFSTFFNQRNDLGPISEENFKNLPDPRPIGRQDVDLCWRPN